MNILFATSEAVPFVKTGGLADVAGSLPPALARLGADVRVILPLYEEIPAQWREQMVFLEHFQVQLSWRKQYCGLFSLEHAGVTWYFIDNEYYFKRSGLYGHYDDGERFGFFSRAVLKAVSRLEWKPEIIHCNDWQTALIPVYLKDLGDTDVKTVFTIHNIEYQGRYGRAALGDLFGLSGAWLRPDGLLHGQDISLVRGAIYTADAVNTVSPSYAQELCDPFFACGMEAVIRENRHKLSGILNGVDTALYHPETDPSLSAGYSADAPQGKAENKHALQRMLGLAEHADTPLVGCVSRLVSHKGFDLVTARMGELMELDIQMVVVGTGDWSYEEAFRQMKARYPGRVAVHIGYSAPLACAVYAGADMLLMPSRSEPCGMAQMIAMRYGTVPVVRETGGLRDSVPAWNPVTKTGYGFTFQSYGADDMLDALRRAVETYRDKDEWARIMYEDMTADLGWDKSAGAYMDIYRALTGK